MYLLLTFKLWFILMVCTTLLVEWLVYVINLNIIYIYIYIYIYIELKVNLNN